jgi:hypothetical protein
MTYTADKKKYIIENIKVIIISQIPIFLLCGIELLGILVLCYLLVYIDMCRNENSMILPSFTISDTEIYINKHRKIQFDDIDLEKSKINTQNIILLHKSESWKNKVIINPKMYNEDIINILPIKLNNY